MATATATPPLTCADHRLTSRGIALIAVAATALAFAQSPGRIAADTKLDLTANPWGFLARAAHLWTPTAPLGQVQNQAYGYFFPHGAFFAAGHLLHIPPWVTQRLWWALLLVVGVVGVVKLTQALQIGSAGSRLFAGAVFALSPRVLTTIGSISSETLPTMLAPWVVLGVVVGLSSTTDGADGRTHSVAIWRLGLRAAVPIALMGAVNAVATVAATAVGVVWWLLQYRRNGPRRWIRFGAWWAFGTALVCAWWIVPLLLLSRVSPPFLDFIESSRVTTQWSSLTEVLRGTSAWTPFVSPERVAGAILVTQPAAVLATGVLAAAGLAGLTMTAMPYRRTLVAILGIGLLFLCLGYAGEWGSPLAEQVRTFLDGPGAPLRNLHKFDPFVRLPLALGIAHLIARVPLPPDVGIRDALAGFANPQRSRPVATVIVLLVALLGAGTLAWTGGLAGDATYRSLPQHWRDAASWLDHHANGKRALVVPGSPFAQQLWGTTRDEPMQALAATPWAVRDAIPLVPPPAIRALDEVQRAIADGRGSPTFAATLARLGVGYVILRADLDPRESRSARPLLAQQTLLDSPGITRVAQFGPDVAPAVVRDVVVDDGLRPPMPAIQIFAVARQIFAPGTRPVLVDAASMPRVVGGPEGLPPGRLSILDPDARAAHLPSAPIWITDSPTARETDFGRVDDNRSAIRAPGDPRRTRNAVADYPASLVDAHDAARARVHGQWLLDNQPDAVRVRASSSASDATQPGQTAPAHAPAAAFDGDGATSWLSAGLDRAVGQWLELEFAVPHRNLAVSLTTTTALGPDVTAILVTTENGTAVAQGVKPGVPVTVSLPPGPTTRVQIRAIATADGSAGNQFALSEVEVTDLSGIVPFRIRHRVVLPPPPGGATVVGWSLRQEQPGRSECVADAQRVRCSPGLGVAPETPGVFSRVLWVPASPADPIAPIVTLRPRPGDVLNRLLAQPGRVVADGESAVADPRGSSSAAVDGDPATTWIAPEASADTTAPPPKDGKRRKLPKNAKQARLTLRLPVKQRVEKLVLTLPRGYPAAPAEVAVDLGTGPQVRRVGSDGVVTLDPAVTDHITLTVRRGVDLINVNNLGFARTAPVGITNIALIPAAPMPVRDDARPIHLGCDAGLTVSVSGQVVSLQADTTVGALRSGRPVLARPCGPIRLASGEQELTVNPGLAFSVDGVEINAASRSLSDAETPRRVPTTTRWDATRRTVQINAAPTTQILVVPESVNPGWRAELAGKPIAPVTVNGWQQGWIIPAGASGVVDLTYPLDGPYRWALGLGLGILAVVLALACTSGSGSRSTGSRSARARHSALAAAAGVSRPPQTELAIAPLALLASWLLAGWAGLTISVIVGAATWWWTTNSARYPGVPVVATFTLFFAATCGLAAGPWKSPTGYHGFDWWIQGLAFAAVAVTMWRSILRDPRGPE